MGPWSASGALHGQSSFFAALPPPNKQLDQGRKVLKVEGALGVTKGRRECLERRLQKGSRINYAGIETQQKQTNLLSVEEDMPAEVA